MVTNSVSETGRTIIIISTIVKKEKRTKSVHVIGSNWAWSR